MNGVRACLHRTKPLNGRSRVSWRPRTGVRARSSHVEVEVTRLIRSAIRLGEDVEINGIRFHPIVPFQGDQVVVSKAIEAQGFRKASKLFDEHLLPVVDAVT